MKHKIGIQLHLHFISPQHGDDAVWLLIDESLLTKFSDIDLQLPLFFYLNFAGQVRLDFQIMQSWGGADSRYSLDQEGWLETIASARFPLLPDSPISPPPLSPRSQRPIRKWFFHQILEKISPHMATRGWQNNKEWRLFKFSSSLSTFSSLPSLIWQIRIDAMLSRNSLTFSGKKLGAP